MDELQLHIPSRVFLGRETLSRLGGVAENFGARALLVPDSILADGPLPGRISEILKRKGIQLILAAGIEADSFHDVVAEIVSLAKASRTQMIIGLGGIRTLSTAKCAAALAGGDRRVDDLLDGYPVTSPRCSFIQIPTTFRDPFLLSHQLLMLDSRNRRARILEIPGLVPDAVILDPALTETLPEKYVISTLLDTFLYALEGYLSLKNNFLSESLFLKSLALVDGALKILGDPQHQEEFRDRACQAGISAAMGLAMSRLGAGSGLAFALGGRFAVPKSLLAAMMIPPVLEYGAAAAPDKLARIAVILEADVRGMKPAQAAFRAVELMRERLGARIGELRIPNLRIRRDEMADTAEFVHSYPMIKDMPGSLGVKDLQDMIRRAL